MKTNARTLALEILNDIFGNDAYANISLDRHLRASDLSALDRNFVTALVYGVVAKEKLLAWYLAPFLKKNPKPWAHMLMLMTLYQILFMDKVPTSAAVDEAVKLAKRQDGQAAGNFVNAVLRNFMRSERREELPKDWETLYSMPKVILDKLVKQFGGKRTGELLAALEVPSKASLRVISHREEILAEFPELSESKIAASGLTAASGNFSRTEAFSKGWISLQDETSQLVAPILMEGCEGSEEVLDACAAPGGKTVHIASYLTTGEVIACDLYDHKLELIRQNAERLGLSDKIKLVKADARKQEFEQKFDRILVDAPCSGLGLMRRKPDIKYRKEAADFANLQKIQLDILSNSVKSLKKGAIMVYSTCTLVDEENFDVVKSFLKEHPEMEQLPIDHEKKEILQEGCLFITPEQFHTDGFFIAKFRKIS